MSMTQPELDFELYHENSCQLKGAINISNYIRGGKGIVTLKSPSGKHHTYSFREPVQENTFKEGVMFCYCMVREHTWRYVGMLQPNGEFWLTQQSRYGRSSEIFKGAQYIVKMMYKDFDTLMELYHEGVCSVCGRKLTKPESIRKGVGPTCLKQLKDLDNLS